jgi:hypothetical protein
MLATGLILATLSVVWVHRVIEVANDVVEALGGSRMCNWNCGHQCDGSSGAKGFGTYRKSRHLLVLLELAGSEDRPPFNKRCSISYVGKRDESGQGRKLLSRMYFNVYETSSSGIHDFVDLFHRLRRQSDDDSFTVSLTLNDRIAIRRR